MRKNTQKNKDIRAEKREFQEKKKRKSGLRRFFGWGIKWGFISAIWGAVALAVIVFVYAYNLPDIHDAMKIERRPTITVIDKDGIALARYGQAQGDMIPVQYLPPHLIQAVLATEDRRFYDHFGIDPIGILRAGFTNIRAGRVVQGGSTITQQLAKNLFLNHERTFRRKIEELLVAIWLEAKYSKNEILTAYLNRVYLGSGNYGMDAAAEDYFGKPITDVNLEEAAILAGLLRAPSRYSPKRNPRLARQRAQTVIGLMKDAGFLQDGQTVRLPQADAQEQRNLQRAYARYYADWIVDQIPSFVGLYRDDLVVETTFDPILQRIAHDQINKTLQESGTESTVGQGAALVMTKNGAVLAMIGGKSYTQSQFNRTTQANRPVGSAFKTILFLSALESGQFTPNSLIDDSSAKFGDYEPQNFDKEYRGWIRFEDALIESRNIPSVRILHQIGLSRLKETARRLGITAQLNDDLSLALGSAGVSMMEITAAYAVIANGGYAVQPYGITAIRKANGDILYERPATNSPVRIVRNDHSAQMRDMLRHVVQQGTGGRAQLKKHRTHGKTGTSQDYRDAWFIGWSENLVTSVWFGNDNNSPMKRVTGSTLPARTFKSILETYFEETNQQAESEETLDSQTFVNRILRGLFQD